jgi:hypothetical protein
MCGTANGDNPRWQLRYEVSHPNPYLHAIISATSLGDTYISPGSSVSSRGQSACANTDSVPRLVRPSANNRAWNGGSAVSISATEREHAARIRCSSAVVYFFASCTGFKAATVSSALKALLWIESASNDGCRSHVSWNLVHVVRMAFNPLQYPSVQIWSLPSRR